MFFRTTNAPPYPSTQQLCVAQSVEDHLFRSTLGSGCKWGDVEFCWRICRWDVIYTGLHCFVSRISVSVTLHLSLASYPHTTEDFKIAISRDTGRIETVTRGILVKVSSRFSSFSYNTASLVRSGTTDWKEDRRKRYYIRPIYSGHLFLARLRRERLAQKDKR